MKQDLNRFALGLLVGAFSAFFVSALIDEQVNDTLADEWPTLFIFASTITAAIIALRGPQAQIEQQHLIEENRNEARLTAARALLPLVASDIHRLCSQAIQLSFEEEIFFKEISNREITLGKLQLSTTTIERISFCLENAKQNEKAILQLVLAQYQICLARTDRRFDSHFITDHVEDSIKTAFDWALLRGFGNHLYDLGRSDHIDLGDYLDITKINFSDVARYSTSKWNIISKVEDRINDWNNEMRSVKVKDVRNIVFRKF